MQQPLVDDLTIIFQGKLDSSLFDKLIHCLDAVIEIHRDMLFLKTRNDRGQLLTFSSTRYFSVIPHHSEAPVIFAGACEPNRLKNRHPVIRFRNNNPSLDAVPHNLKFTYKKPGWSCVIITTKTIDILTNLMESEISKYIATTPKAPSVAPIKKKKVSLQKATPKKMPHISGLGYYIVILLTGIIFAAIYFSIRSSNNTDIGEDAPLSQDVPSSQDSALISKPVEQTTSVAKAPPPKPLRTYSFVVQGGKKISASVFPANEYGKGRQIIIFAPFMEYSDGNFYTASLAALHNIFGKRRGLFNLENARKEYDSIIQGKVIYWIISNPNQRFYCFPIVDIDTEGITSIVVWIK